MALLRVKLDTEYVSALNHGNEITPVARHRQHVLRIVTDDVIRVDEVEARLLVEFHQQRTRAAACSPAPTHVRRLQPAVTRRTTALARCFHEAEPSQLALFA